MFDVIPIVAILIVHIKEFSKPERQPSAPKAVVLPEYESDSELDSEEIVETFKRKKSSLLMDSQLQWSFVSQEAD